MKHIKITLFLLISLFAFPWQATAQSVNFGNVDMGYTRDKFGWINIEGYSCGLTRKSPNEGVASGAFSVQLPHSSTQIDNFYKKNERIPQMRLQDSDNKQTIVFENAKITNIVVQNSGITVILDPIKVKFISNTQETRWDFTTQRPY
jgi:hypothetical protein